MPSKASERITRPSSASCCGDEEGDEEEDADLCITPAVTSVAPSGEKDRDCTCNNGLSIWNTLNGPASYIRRLNSCTVLFSVTTAKTRPSGSNTASEAVGTVSWPWHKGDRKSQRRMVLSREAERNVSSKGHISSAVTRARWPRKYRRSRLS